VAQHGTGISRSGEEKLSGQHGQEEVSLRRQRAVAGRRGTGDHRYAGHGTFQRTEIQRRALQAGITGQIGALVR